MKAHGKHQADFCQPVNHIIISKLLPAWPERANVREIVSENHINRKRFKLLHHSKLMSR